MSFLRLVRIQNLAIIALTMIAIYIMCHTYSEQRLTSFPTNFIAFIASTVLLAAAGNIINDYYDIDADKVNKPNQLIIDKTISAKSSLIVFFTFNSIALGLGLFLSLKYQTSFFFLSNFIIAFLLWWYSFTLKKIYLIGNILIAGLLAYAPIIATSIYFTFTDHLNSATIYTVGIMTIFFAFFAFTLNLIREILKDVTDIEGDLKINSQSFAIQKGIDKTVKIVRILLIGTISVLALILFFWFSIDLIITLLMLIKCTFLLAKPNKNNVKRSILLIKLSLIPPLVSPCIVYLIRYVF